MQKGTAVWLLVFLLALPSMAQEAAETEEKEAPAAGEAEKAPETAPAEEAQPEPVAEETEEKQEVVVEKKDEVVEKQEKVVEKKMVIEKEEEESPPAADPHDLMKLQSESPLFRRGKASLDLAIEYRLRNIYINPLELNGQDAVEVAYGINRLRTGANFNWDDKVKIMVQMDFLDGALVGDNGILPGHEPFPNEGSSTAARWPNEAGIAVVLKEGADPLDSDSYTYGLKKIEPVKVRRAWGEVNVGAGQLRVGRMPTYEGRGILANDGDNDLNRFGTTSTGNTTDRIVFGTKPLEIAKVIAAKGDRSVADQREDRGMFFAFAWDHLVDDAIQFSGDDTNQFVAILFYKVPEYELFGIKGEGFKISSGLTYRQAHDVELEIFAIPFELHFNLGDFNLEFQFGATIGQTREVSEAMTLISSGDPVVQDISAFGMLAIADYKIGPLTVTFEFDYASGDGDPREDSGLNDFYFAKDTKVGLLLFPQVLAYETARTAAASQANLIGQNSLYVPSTRLATQGCFRNAIAVFPQLTYHLTPDVFVRFGALFAWADEPHHDPYESLLNEDGEEIKDDWVNYNGGKPGTHYGTELDLRFSAKLWGHFIFDLEGAILFPGDALFDEHGDAVTSAMIEARMTYRF